jgi:hypothetical protein
MSEELKKIRTVKKSAFTREVNTTLKFLECDMTDEVQKRMEKIKSKFSDLEEAHEAYHITLEEENLIGESDSYFDKLQDTYISVMKQIDEKIASTSKSAKMKISMQNDTDEQPANPSNIITRELLNLINLPRVEMKPYDGDPLKFHSFFATFDVVVDRGMQDPSVKLTRLLQYTTGKANAAISSCGLIGGEAGYKQARDILTARFGNHHLVADTVIQRLKCGRPVKSADELLVLSDELCNGVTILKNLSKLCEVDTQSSIIHIVDRLQPYLKNRWRRHAMDMKREKDCYPSFSDFVEFIRMAAEDASDPVYGSSGSQTKLQDNSKNASSFFTSYMDTGHIRPAKPCILCKQNHRLFYCDTFKNLKPVERLDVVKSHKLCQTVYLIIMMCYNVEKIPFALFLVVGSNTQNLFMLIRLDQKFLKSQIVLNQMCVE